MANGESRGAGGYLGWATAILIGLGVAGKGHFGGGAGDSGAAATPEKYSSAKSDAGDLRKSGPRLNVRLELPRKDPIKPPAYLEPIAKAVGLTTDEFCGTTPGNENYESLDAWGWANLWAPQLEKYNPKFLIAAVPDPDRSRSAYRFDLALEALQRAATAVSSDGERMYVLDHYYLPWQRSGSSDNPDAHDPEKYPGVLVFRSVPSTPASNRPGPMLIVLLVGDAPVGGLHTRTLETCFDIVTALPRRKDLRPDLKIVGPFFSGSQQSLQLALQHWWQAKCKQEHFDQKLLPSIHAIGTGTQLDPARFAVSQILSNGKKFLDPTPTAENPSTQAETVSLRMTVVPDEVLIEHLLAYLSDLHGGSKFQVAQLRESDTGYGASLSTRAATKSDKIAYEIIDVPFPIHISRVLSWHAETTSKQTKDVPQFNSVDEHLRIPTDPIEGTADSVPEQSEKLTGVYHNIVLTSLLAKLQQHHVEYVLISATDPRDKVFLASVVNKYCPNARILLDIGDQLFTHADYARYLSGAYVVSSYPLPPHRLSIAPGSLHTDAQSHLSAFGEQQVFAYYNAVVLQLKKPEALLHYYDEQVSRYGPKIWISQLGLRGAHTLKINSIVPKPESCEMASFQKTFALPDKSTELPDKPAMTRIIHSHAPFWWMIWLIGCNVTLWFAALKICMAVPSTDRWTPYSVGIQSIVAVLSLLLTGYTVSLTWAEYFITSPKEWSDVFYLDDFLLESLLTMLVLCASLLILGTVSHRVLKTHVAVGFLISIPFVCLASAIFGFLVCNDLPRIVRTKQITDGLSPLVPFSLLCLLGLGWCYLLSMRLLWLRELKFDWSTLTKEELATNSGTWPEFPVSKFQTAMEQLHDYASHVWIIKPWPTEKGNGYAIASLVMVTVGFVACGALWLPSPDGRLTYAMGFALIGGALIVCNEIGRLRKLWTLLESVHHKVVALPMQHAFERLPEHYVDKYGSLLHVDSDGNYRSRMLQVTRVRKLRGLEDYQVVLKGINDHPRDKKIATAIENEFATAIQNECKVAFTDLMKWWQTRSLEEAFTVRGASDAKPARDNQSFPIGAGITGWTTTGQDGGNAPFRSTTLLSRNVSTPAEADKDLLPLEQERLLAMSIVVSLSQYRRYLKWQIKFLLYAAIFMVLTAASYPFEPQEMMLTFIGLLALVCLIVIFQVFVGLSQDEFLSRVNGTAPSLFSLSPDSLQTLVLVILPLVLLVASQLPGGEVLYTWLLPMARILPAH